MKKLVAFFVAVTLCLTVSVNAAAVHTEIQEEDPFTGQPLDAYAEDGDDGGYARVWINDTTQYDRGEKMYAYENENVSPSSIYASVADGMIVAESVEIKIPAGVTPILYLGGKEVKDADYSHIETPGVYTLKATGTGASPERILDFTILNKITNKVTFTVPAGFTITEARLNNESLSHGSKSVDLQAEGNYVFRYSCNEIERSYELEIEVDHTPPKLEHIEALTDHVSKGPVDISDMEEGVTASIKLGNREIKAKDTLKQSGIYHIVLTDQAGNKTTYSFRILMYFNMSAIGFIILLALAVAALVIYLVVSRRKLRVR